MTLTERVARIADEGLWMGWDEGYTSPLTPAARRASLDRAAAVIREVLAAQWKMVREIGTTGSARLLAHFEREHLTSAGNVPVFDTPSEVTHGDD